MIHDLSGSPAAYNWENGGRHCIRERRFYLSSDGGRSFRHVATRAGTAPHTFRILYTHARVLIINSGETKKLRMTSDGGLTWQVRMHFVLSQDEQDPLRGDPGQKPWLYYVDNILAFVRLVVRSQQIQANGRSMCCAHRSRV